MKFCYTIITGCIQGGLAMAQANSQKGVPSAGCVQIRCINKREAPCMTLAFGRHVRLMWDSL